MSSIHYRHSQSTTAMFSIHYRYSQSTTAVFSIHYDYVLNSLCARDLIYATKAEFTMSLKQSFPRHSKLTKPVSWIVLLQMLRWSCSNSKRRTIKRLLSSHAALGSHGFHQQSPKSKAWKYREESALENRLKLLSAISPNILLAPETNFMWG